MSSVTTRSKLGGLLAIAKTHFDQCSEFYYEYV
jgi:hypothetical protein